MGQKLQIELEVDNKGAIKSIKSLNDSVVNLNDTIDDTSKNTSKLKKGLTAVGNAGKKVGKGGLKAVAFGLKGIGKAYKAGVKIAFGTDAGVFGHGKNAREFELMHEAGMPVVEAIQSATLNAADLLGQSQNLGTIEVGKSADIIAVEGNPVETIQSMSKVKFVMRDGIVMKNLN